MNSKTTLWLMIAVLALGSFIWLVERRTDSTTTRVEYGARAFRFAADRINYLDIQQGDWSVGCRRIGGSWFLANPLGAHADDACVNRILDRLETLPKEEVVTRRQRQRRGLTLANYGLAEPRAVITLGGAGERYTLLIGGNTQVRERLYVKLNSSEDVIATTTNVLLALPGKIEDFRDRRIFHGDADSISRLEIVRRGGTIRLARTDGGWVILQPEISRADDKKVNLLLDALYSLRIHDFISDSKPDPNAYGLGPDDAVARAIVWFSGQDAGEQLIVGKAREDGKGGAYAKSGDADSIYTVGTNVVAVLSLNANELRDRQVYTFDPAQITGVSIQEGERKLVLRNRGTAGWSIAEPLECKAENAIVEELIENILSLHIAAFLDENETNLSVLGLQPPSLVIEVLTGTNAEASVLKAGEPAATATISNRSLWIGAKAPNANLVAAKFTDEKTIFELPLNDVKRFFAGRSSQGLRSTDPLIYRNRTILDLAPSGIRSITVSHGGAEQTVERNESGVWKTVNPATGVIAQNVIEDMLSIVGNLRAVTIEGDSISKLSAYGIDESSRILTFGLSGKDGIQKKLILGAAARGGIYAMVQGQDLVFVIDRRTADKLSQNILTSAAATK